MWQLGEPAAHQIPRSLTGPATEHDTGLTEVIVPEPDDAGAGESEALLEPEPEVLPYALSDAPFARGEVVKHAVYGSGTVRESVMTGQQWSVRVDFSSGERSILSHFLEGSVEEAYNSDEYGAPEAEPEVVDGDAV